MMIYHSLQKLCKKQNFIIEGSMDQTALSHAFQVFPQMRELTLHFCTVLECNEWLESYIKPDMTMTEKSYEHHVQVISNALALARLRGSLVDTVHLSGLQLRPHHVKLSDLMAMSGALQELLSGMRKLRVTQSQSALDLLSQCALDVCQIDLCSLLVNYETLRNLLVINKSSLDSIGFHNVQLSEMPERIPPQLTANLLLKILSQPKDAPTLETICHCVPYGNRNQRLSLEDTAGSTS
jgi:hypothetical protein